MRKQKWFMLVTIVLVALFAVGCSWGQKTKLGEVGGKKDDEAAIKEVVEAYYAKLKNFEWESFDKEAGLEFWTTEGRERYLAEEADSLAESVKKQKLSIQLKEIEFKEIKIEENKAAVNLVSQEQCSSEVTKDLNGAFQGYGQLELQKKEQTWQIESSNFQLIKFTS
ncbi:MAG: hypothetical protein PHS83_06330 [Clostridia bacterium]|nr:hypothetical protein [Clostridia bacterium]MDD4666025.1 hypothetical protein [Clostridia bacterium]